MIGKQEMMELLIKACPSYESRWTKYIAQPEYDPELVYVHIGDFADHLVHLFQQGNIAEFPSVFDAIERFHIEGDRYVREAATIGCLEGIQNFAGNNGVDPEVFFTFLNPESAKQWKALNEFWRNIIM